MKLLHVADLHFDRPFEGLGRTNEELKKTLLHANQQVLNNIANLAITKNVDLVILAGDTFHQAKITIHYQQLLWDFFKRLEIAGIQIVIVFGNHDYYQATRYWQKFPPNVVVFTSETVKTKIVKVKSDCTVAIHAFSYEQTHITKSKINEFGLPSQADFQIGIYHGQQGNNNYAPFNLSDMKTYSYDYWALGHIHQYTKLTERIFYPGTPQGKTIKEGNKGRVLVVELFENRKIKVTCESVATIDWLELSVSIEPDNMSEMLEKLIQNILFELRNCERTTLVQLTLMISNNIGQDWLEEWQQLERLSYLQELLYQKSNGLYWLVNCHLKADEQLAAKINFLDQDWLQQLIVLYRKEEIYAANYDELKQHPILLKDFVPFLKEQKNAIIDEAFVEFQQELGGAVDDY